MTLLTPLIAGIAAAIAIPSLLILYFLRLKRKDVEVSTTLLWKKSIEDLQANAPFQRLRNNILLILQLIALLFILFALAQPEWRGATIAGSRHIIVIDRSASMSAADGEPDKPESRVTRLEAAKKKAIAFVDSMQEPGLLGDAGDEAMVIAFDVTADRLQNFTSNKTLLRRAIEGIQSTDAPTSFTAAFQTARGFAQPVVVEDTGLVTPGGAAVIHLFSDGRLPDLAQAQTTSEDKIVYYPVGGNGTWNVGITGLRAERAFDEPSRLSIFVGLQNSSRDAQSVEVQLAVDGRVQEIKSVNIPAAKSPDGAAAAGGAAAGTGTPGAPELIPSMNGTVFTLDRAQGGVFSLQVRGGGKIDFDALTSDNYGYLVVPPAKRLSVMLVTGGNLFLRKLLTKYNLARLEVVTPAEAEARFAGGVAPTDFDVFVLDGWLPTIKLDGKEAPGLPPGRFMVFNAIPSGSIGLKDEGAGDPTVPLSWERGHPALRNLVLDGITINPSRKLSVPPRANVKSIAEGVSGPLIYEGSDLGTRALVATFDILNSNWPFDASFVLYVAQGLTYLGQDGGDAGALIKRPGETIEQQLPSGAADARITLPDDARQDLLIASDGRVVYGPISRVGIYSLSWSGPPAPADQIVEGRPRRRVTANLLDPSESDISTLEPAKLKAMSQAVEEGGATKGARRLWPWALLAALFIVLVEWYVYNRKVVV